MGDLPEEIIEPGPPFSSVGVDIFGPWPVIVKKTTRGVRTTSKYWAILFTCRVSRAKHIELVEDMNSESFINALRGFKAILGAFQDDMSQWKFVKKLADEFWRKWQLEYVHYLQTCRK